jgi:antitoxin (DNA-binding transcriptional repressor) of toxin-antitoxin stability system
MKRVSIHDAKTHFSSLLAKLEKDSESIVIRRNGEPVGFFAVFGGTSAGGLGG